MTVPSSVSGRVRLGHGQDSVPGFCQLRSSVTIPTPPTLKPPGITFSPLLLMLFHFPGSVADMPRGAVIGVAFLYGVVSSPGRGRRRVCREQLKDETMHGKPAFPLGVSITGH